MGQLVSDKHTRLMAAPLGNANKHSSNLTRGPDRHPLSRLEHLAKSNFAIQE